MNFLIFLAALSASVLAFELTTSFQRTFDSFGKGNIGVGDGRCCQRRDVGFHG